MAPKRPSDEKGRTARAVAQTFLDRPAKVRLDEKRLALLWERPVRETRVPVPDDLLEKFVSLLAEPDPADAIQRFAANFGALQLCKEHELPYSHYPHPFPKPQNAPTIYVCAPAYRESIDRWLRFAKQLRAVMSIASDLNGSADESPQLTWTEALSGPLLISVDRKTVDDQAAFATLVRACLFVGDVRPRIIWEKSEATPALELGGGLFGALAFQLMQWSTADQGIYFCRNCGRPYTPRRRAHAGEATYCDLPKCQKRRKAMNARAFRKANP